MLLYFEDDRSLLQNASVKDSAASLLQHISTSLQHSFPSLLCNLSSPTFLFKITTRLCDTLFHSYPTLLLYNAPRHSPPTLLYKTSRRHFSPRSLNNTFRPHSSPTLLYKIISRISEDIIYNTSLQQLNMIIQRSSLTSLYNTLCDTSLQHSSKHFSAELLATLPYLHSER